MNNNENVCKNCYKYYEEDCVFCEKKIEDKYIELENMKKCHKVCLVCHICNEKISMDYYIDQTSVITNFFFIHNLIKLIILIIYIIGQFKLKNPNVETMSYILLQK